MISKFLIFFLTNHSEILPSMFDLPPPTCSPISLISSVALRLQGKPENRGRTSTVAVESIFHN